MTHKEGEEAAFRAAARADAAAEGQSIARRHRRRWQSRGRSREEGSCLRTIPGSIVEFYAVAVVQIHLDFRGWRVLGWSSGTGWFGDWGFWKTGE